MKITVFVIIFVSVSVTAAFGQSVTPAAAGFSVEREIAGGRYDSYEIKLGRGEKLAFIVEQDGVDVVLKITSVGGKFIDRIDSPNGTSGEEPYSFIAVDAVTLSVKVEPWNQVARVGKYRVKPIAITKASTSEMRLARLRAELLAIIEADNARDYDVAVLKRYFDPRALDTNPYGYVSRAEQIIGFASKNPYTPPVGSSNSIELSDVRLEEHGDIVVVSLYRMRRYRDPAKEIDRAAWQRIGYMFRRSGGSWRILSSQRTPVERERHFIALDAKQLDAFVGVYEGKRAWQTFTVTREGPALYSKHPSDTEPSELSTEGDDTFFGSFFSLRFLRDDKGAVTGAVVYYPYPEDRLQFQRKTR
jgi:hypothetical protein